MGHTMQIARATKPAIHEAFARIGPSLLSGLAAGQTYWLAFVTWKSRCENVVTLALPASVHYEGSISGLLNSCCICCNEPARAAPCPGDRRWIVEKHESPR